MRIGSVIISPSNSHLSDSLRNQMMNKPEILGKTEAGGVRVYAKKLASGEETFCVTDGIEFTFLPARDLLEAAHDFYVKKMNALKSVQV